MDDLRLRLKDRGYDVLEDSTMSLPGDSLPGKVREAIDRADHVIGVISPAAVTSEWVKRELRYAKKLAASRRGFRVIPLRLVGATPAELREIFELPEPERDSDLEDWPPELIAIDVGSSPGAMDVLMTRIVDALEGRCGALAMETTRRVTDMADIVLRLRDPHLEVVEEGGVQKRRPVARATLAFYPPNAGEPQSESPEFTFVAPLGKIEAGDLSYYLERYHITPFGVFAARARAIENRFPAWGEDLWSALDPDRPEHAKVIKAWKQKAVTAQRRFTIEVAPLAKPRRDATEEQLRAYRQNLEAATELLALPWELVNDGRGYLFHDGVGVRVRRSLPGGDDPAELPDEMRKPPLRVLIVCARPEAEGVGYIDHRVSVRPVTEALNALGELARYDILAPPTFPALKAKLRDALERGEPYHIVHFDGHGVYDKLHGLGGLVFEDPEAAAAGKLARRGFQVVNADRLGAELRNAGVGLFFLEACQTAKSEEKPEASVAGKLLQSGIASVAAMSHSVLVETARRFTEVFYPALVSGQRVGTAMLKGQQHLYDQRARGWAWEPRQDGSGKVDRHPLELQDWFVPVLYQDGEDPALLTAAPPARRVQEEIQKGDALDLGALPAPPEHAFVGRSRELLAAERLLVEQGKRYVVLRGEGGEGKTTLAAELARWLVSTRRMERAAFASVENVLDARAVAWAWGAQLVPNFASQAGETLETAENLVVRALRERSSVLVLDNVESILPPPEGSEAAAARVFDQATLDAILDLCRRLLEEASNTRLIFTSREPLPDGTAFDSDRHLLSIGRLGITEGMELVARVLAQAGNERDAVSAEALQAQREEEIKTLVETVNGHARSLVLLTPELATRGLAATVEDLQQVMADLEKRHTGERERSLFASVELSLRRLPAAIRAKLAPLGVFLGGGNVQSLGIVADLDRQRGEDAEIASWLHVVGLIEVMPPEKMPYLRFDPALAPALLRELTANDPSRKAEIDARSRWAIAYLMLADFLYHQRAREPEFIAQLMLAELPNMVEALQAYANNVVGRATPPLPEINATAEVVIEFATRVEALLTDLGRRDVMGRVSAIRAMAYEIHERSAAGALTEAGFRAARQEVDQLLHAGRATEAIAAARQLLGKFEGITDDVYPGAGGDRALAHATLGRALEMGGFPEEALGPLRTAQMIFESRAQAAASEDGRTHNLRMASVALVEQADCLADLGNLTEAAEKYEEAIGRAEKLGDRRQVAVNKFQLGSTRLSQRRYDEALEIYHEAHVTFAALGEPRQVAVIWHQIGCVHLACKRFDEAEAAFQTSLAIKVRLADKRGEAATRVQFGVLYSKIPGRIEEAVLFSLQAAQICADLGDRISEAVARNNAASDLLSLNRFDEARAELVRTLECLRGLSINSEPWLTWMLLSNLERKVGNTTAAAYARRQARSEYEKARRQGWQITDGGGAKLCEMIGFVLLVTKLAVAEENRAAIMDEAEKLEAQLRGRLHGLLGDPETPSYLRILAPKLLAVLDGARDAELAEDPDLDYDDAVELKLLLEKVREAGV